MNTNSPEQHDASGDASKRSWGSRFRDISTLTAIASLVVALIFNGLQVRNNADQAQATRRATELQLLTQLNTLVAESQATLEPRGKEIERVEREEGGELSSTTGRDLGVAIKNMDYLAWLYNNRFVNIPGSRQLWDRRMKCIYVTAVLLYGSSVRNRVENLKRFVDVPEGESRTELEAVREATC